MDYRLPTEYQWEYAARGGLSNNIYPWEDFIHGMIRDVSANFKPLRVGTEMMVVCIR